MKSFKEYIIEDIEVFSGDIAGHLGKFGRHIEDEIKTVKIMSRGDFEHIDHGTIPSEIGGNTNYSLHQFVTTDHSFAGREGKLRNHQIYIVHQPTQKIVGRIDAMGWQRGSSRSKDPRDFKDSLRVEGLDVDPRHREKRIGHSLAIAAYRMLHRAGHPIVSSSLHTFGGAKLWDRMRSDPELGARMVLHNPTDMSIRPARHLPSNLIWGAPDPIKKPSEAKLNPEMDREKIEKGGHIDSYLEILSPTESVERK